ncbi:MAG: response regulator [Candidatus Omnitrophica bacterium]|nr:response regulator [Candidatus Omnitrophota bacterium]
MIKLLTVDDELDVCDFIKDFFSQRGYAVFVALNGKDALSVVKKEKPRIVFLDIIMPDTNGLEILKQIKEFDPSIKVIMVTVSDDNETKDQAKQLGADEFIRKPFSKRYLEEVVIQKIIELTDSLKKE